MLDACVLLMTHSRLTTIQKRYPLAPELVKYNRAHLLNFFDGLHKYKDFANLSIDDFPLRDGPLIGRTLRRNAFDPNDDPDAEVGNDFYAEPASTVNVTNPTRQSSSEDEQEDEIFDVDPIDEAMKVRGIPRIVARCGRIIAAS
jgi:hypothetical protein